MFQAEYEAQVDRYEEEQELLIAIDNAQIAFDILGVIAYIADRIDNGNSADEHGALLAIQSHAERARKVLAELGAQEFEQETVQ